MNSLPTQEKVQTYFPELDAWVPGNVSLVRDGVEFHLFDSDNDPRVHEFGRQILQLCDLTEYLHHELLKLGYVGGVE